MSAIHQLLASLGNGFGLSLETAVTNGSTQSPLIYSAQQVVALSATKVLASYDTSSLCQVVVADMSGGVLTVGTPATLTTTGTLVGSSIAVLSATKAIAMFSEPSTGRARAVVLDISGSTVTVNTAVDMEAAFAADFSIISLTSTKALACWYNTSSGFVKCSCLDISGSTITVNNVDSLGVSSSRPHLSFITSTTALLSYLNASSYPTLVVVSVSGSTTSHGTAVTPIANSGQIPRSQFLSATQLAFIRGDAGTEKISVANISGTSISMGSTISVGAAGENQSAAVLLSTNKFLLLSAGLNVLYGRIVTFDGTNFTAASPTTLVATMGQVPLAVCALSAVEAVMVYSNSGSPAREVYCGIAIR